jgi:RNA recognition motif-containing protein
MKTLYVGNISFKTTEDELRKMFEPYGDIGQVTIPRDRLTGNSRGFAFVEMRDENAAEALLALNGARLGDRTLVVNKARPRAARAEDTGRDSGERRFGRS